MSQHFREVALCNGHAVFHQVREVRLVIAKFPGLFHVDEMLFIWARIDVRKDVTVALCAVTNGAHAIEVVSEF